MIERTINGSVRKIDPADHIANLGARLIAMEKRLDEIERILAIIKINLRVSDGIESSSAEDREVQRYEVVLAAQEDVSSNLAFICDIGKRTCGFVVNYEKRTVVCLLRDRYTHKVVARGIAKCAPGDVFNLSIGKAIAMRRALGLGVPREYLNLSNVGGAV